jgi:hypothetical protein
MLWKLKKINHILRYSEVFVTYSKINFALTHFIETLTIKRKLIKQMACQYLKFHVINSLASKVKFVHDCPLHSQKKNDKLVLLPYLKCKIENKRSKDRFYLSFRS